MKKIAQQLGVILLSVTVFAQPAWSVECHQVIKPVVYKVRKGDHLADILRTFNLKPLWCPTCAVAQSSSLTHLKNNNILNVGDIVMLPFRCEQDLADYKLIQRQEHREIDATHITMVRTILPLKSEAQQRKTASDEMRSAPLINSSLSSNQSTQGDSSTADSKKGSQATCQSAQATDQKAGSQLLSTFEVDELNGTFGVELLSAFHKTKGFDASNGSSGTLLSNLSSGVGAHWQMNWSEKVFTNLSFQTEDVKFYTSQSKTISNVNQNLKEIGLIVGYNLSDRMSVAVGMQRGDVVVYRAPSSSEITIDTLPTSHTSVALAYKLVERKKSDLTLKLKYAALNVESTDIYNAGSATQSYVGLQMSKQLKRFKVLGEVSYTEQTMPFSSVNFKSQELKSNLGLEINFGD